MLSWWKKLWHKDRPLTPGVSGRRLKTYSAESGYVYQYCLLGFGRTKSSDTQAMEYVFEYSAARQLESRVSVLLSDRVLLNWAAAHARDLSASERFGIAKMALKSTFDSCPSPQMFPREICPTFEDIESIAATLDL